MRSPIVPSGSVIVQWGHGDGAVEDVELMQHDVDVWELEWGHGDGAVDEAFFLKGHTLAQRAYHDRQASDNEWNLGGLNDWNSRELELPLDFLPEGKMTAESCRLCRCRGTPHAYPDRAKGRQPHDEADAPPGQGRWSGRANPTRGELNQDPLESSLEYLKLANGVAPLGSASGSVNANMARLGGGETNVAGASLAMIFGGDVGPVLTIAKPAR